MATLDSTGSQLLFGSYVGGSGADEGHGIAVDKSGTAYLAGWTASTDFPAANNTLSAATGNAFVARIAGLPRVVAACTKTYAADITGAWETAANWTPPGVPGAADVACIPAISTVNFSFATGNQSISALNNSGTLNISGSTLTLAAESASNITTLSGGTLTSNALLTLSGTFTLSGGTLTGTGTVTANGAFNWTAGTMSGNGVTNANGGMSIPNASVGLDTRTLNASGTTTFGNVSGGSNLFLQNGAVVNNLAAAIWNLVNGKGNGIFFNGGAASAFTNAGTFQMTGGTTNTVNVAFNNNSGGTVAVNTGTLTFSGGGSCGGACAGSWSASAGATVGFGGGTFALSGNFSGAGKVAFSSGTTNLTGTYNVTGGTTASGGTANFNAGATVTSAGALTISGETLNFSTGKAVATTTLTESFGTLTGSDAVTVSGATTWSGGTMSGSGVTNANGGLTIGGFGVALDGRTLNNNGTATLSGVNSSLGLLNGAVFNNAAGSTFNLNNDQSVFGGGGTPAPSFNNAGTFNRGSTTGTATVNIAFNNSGTVNVNSGTLSFFGDGYTQTAGATILNGGKLTSSATLNIQGGMLKGIDPVSPPAITANVSNAGQVKAGLSPGILSINGNYTQLATGAFNVEIGGLTAGAGFGQLNVTGTGAATLGGTLNVTLVGGFTPALGNSFAIMTFTSRTGTLALGTVPTLPTGLTWRLDHNPTSVVLSVQQAGPTPSIVSVSPNSGQQGQILLVAISGQNTHFVQGTTVASFGAGITVNGAVTVSSATSATANITIAANATLGGRTVTLTTGTEVASSAAGTFTVTPAAPLTAVIDPFYSGSYSIFGLGSAPGLPPRYGGLIFDRNNPNVLIIGGSANGSTGKFFTIAVTRDLTNHVNGFSGTASVFSDGAFNDGGLAYEPGGVLFYSRYPVNEVGQIKPGSTIVDKIVPLSPLSLVSSTGALNFVPSTHPGAGQLKISSWSGGEFYTAAYSADGAGTFNITSATKQTTLTGGLEGFIYVPLNSPLFPSPSMLASEYSAGRVASYTLDSNGNPDVASRRNFITGLGGAVGAAIDPLTGDFLFSTFGGGDQVIALRGFTAPSPTVTTISPSSAVAGGPAFTLTVNGTNFVPGSAVNLAEIRRLTTFVSATQLTAVIPAAAIATAGTVTVTNPPPGGRTSNAVNFTVTPAAAPAVTLAPSSLDFGNQVVSTISALRTVTLGNTGGASLGITSITVAGADATQFALSDTATPCRGDSSLAAGASCTFNVRFTPGTVGAKTANIRVVTNARTSPDLVPLSGTGVPAGPGVTLSSKSLSFASQPVGSSSTAQTVTLTNTSPGLALSIASIVASGDFAQTNNCGSALAGSASCTITIVFTPTATGARNGNITLTDNAADSPQVVSLAGIGINAPAIALSSTSLIFGSRLLGATSPPQTTTMTNIGNATLNITSISASGDFAQTNNCGSALASGANCTISATFTPTDVGLRTGGVAITSDAPGSVPVVTLTGVGISSGVALSTTLVIFESQTVNTTSPAQSVTLTNASAATLTISSIVAGGDFAQTNTCGTSVAASSSCTISVTFTPTAVGTRFGSITITDSGSGSPRVITLRGAGSEITLSLSPTILTFGNQKVGTASQPKTITLTNTGGVTLTINSITLTGDYLRRPDSCGPSLAAGAACTINVSFSPTVADAKPRAGAMTVTSNAKGSPHVVDLTGTGVNNAPAVSLSRTSLTFANQVVGTPSTAQVVELKNIGDATLTISNIVASSSDFAQTSPSCTSLEPNTSCVISVTFKPTTEGTKVGSVTLTDNAGDSPQQIVLIGTGVPVVSLSATSVLFGDQVVGTSSKAQTVTLTNNDSLAIHSISIAVSGDFALAQTSTCGTSLLASRSCTISVTFNPPLTTPPAVGPRTGAITIIVDSGLGSPRTITLAGNGTDFSISVPPGSPTSATITAGQAVTFTMTLTPTGGFNGDVTVSCSGKPPAGTCTTTPNSFLLGAPTTITTTVTTTAPSRGNAWPSPQSWPPLGLMLARLPRLLWLLALAMLCSLAAVRRRHAGLGAGACLFLVLLISGCAGGAGSPGTVGQTAGTPPNTYIVTVTAVSTRAERAAA